MKDMAKFEGGYLDHTGYLAIKDQLTASFAAAIEQTLNAMGEDAKGISWFSSIAEDYACERLAHAA